MRQFIDFLGDQRFPVIDFRLRPRYVNGEKTSTLENCLTILYNYEQINIITDEVSAITQEQIKMAADAGTPVELAFKDVEITVRPKGSWEIQATGRASQATIASNGK